MTVEKTERKKVKGKTYGEEGRKKRRERWRGREEEEEGKKYGEEGRKKRRGRNMGKGRKKRRGRNMERKGGRIGGEGREGGGKWRWRREGIRGDEEKEKHEKGGYRVRKKGCKRS